MLRLSTVNKAIKAENIDLELVAGEGYFYVVGPKTEHLANASVYVYRLNDQDLASWMEDIRGFAKEIEKY